MLGLLFTAVSAVAASRAAMSDQYYSQLAREAAESGVAMAESCLRSNNFEPQWTTPLAPDKQCNGATVTPTAPSAYMYEDSKICMTYSVPGPTAVEGGSIQFLIATGTVSLKRKSNNSCGSAWKTYSVQVNGRVGAEATFRNIAFGYYYLPDAYSTLPTGEGAYFGVIKPDGKVQTVGYNKFGQLGDNQGPPGSTAYANRNDPVAFQAPTNVPIRALYTNFLSLGTRIIAVDDNGDAFAAGYNYGGGTASALGINSTAYQYEPRPKLVSMPGAGTASRVKVKYVATLTQSTFYFGDDGKIYATGICTDGQLGTGSSCGATATPTPVALPVGRVPVTDSGWVQSTNVATDGNAVIVRMQDGSVYGWGNNQAGMLAQGTDGNSYKTPVRMGTFGNAGQPKATQVATDGVTSYILDDTGTVYAAGENAFGQLAGAPVAISSVSNAGSLMCLDNDSGLATPGRRLQVWACDSDSGSYATQRIQLPPNPVGGLEGQGYGLMRIAPDYTLCLAVDVANDSVTVTNYTAVRLQSCNLNDAKQRWKVMDSGEIRNDLADWQQSVGWTAQKCLNNAGGGGSGSYVNMYNCDTTNTQDWSLQSSKSLVKVPIPSAAGQVTRITTDERTVLFLTTSGQVWGAGGNWRGQLGNGQSGKLMNPALQRYGRDVSVIASGAIKDFYTTANSTTDTTRLLADSFVVMSDGSVYGSGSNSAGQLGIGSTAASVATPQKMSLPSGIAAGSVQSGYGTTIILTTSGRIYTVGNNSNGQLGDGTNTNSSTPQARKYLNVIPTTFF